MYAFQRLSKDLFKYFPEDPSFLLHIFEAWTQKIVEALDVYIIEENTAEYYFTINNQRSIKQKKSSNQKKHNLEIV